MSHPLVGCCDRSRRLLFPQGGERLAHNFGLGKPTLARGSVEEGSSLRVDSDIQGSHVAFVSQRVIQDHDGMPDLVSGG
jgi:hypothetical protein